ncbi:hypothetical protein GCM10022226_77390 [Sphaerisporangium flaviroseum]|uniref:DUF4352 domain-containing protein n=1 Tax=Sphaerisporangium flaviroseum TaxID=509199 RepID=A0ABP7JF63_9ACTN
MSSSVLPGRRRRRPLLAPAAVLLAATGLGTIAALGGLVEAPPQQPPQRRVGEEIDQDLFRTKIEDAIVHAVSFDGDDPHAPRHTVLDLSLKIYNDAEVSVPLAYLENSLLRIVSREGETLMSPGSAPGAGGTWLYDTTVPGEGAPSRLLPPKRTSAVTVRLRKRSASGDEPGAGKYPDLVGVDVGVYENHEDFLTGRHRAALVQDDTGAPVVVARVTVPVRKAV